MCVCVVTSHFAKEGAQLHYWPLVSGGGEEEGRGRGQSAQTKSISLAGAARQAPPTFSTVQDGAFSLPPTTQWALSGSGAVETHPSSSSPVADTRTRPGLQY